MQLAGPGGPRNAAMNASCTASSARAPVVEQSVGESQHPTDVLAHQLFRVYGVRLVNFITGGMCSFVSSALRIRCLKAVNCPGAQTITHSCAFADSDV